VPAVGLDYYALTLLVVNAYAAAMVGRLTNLPLTFVGAIGLGLAQSYVVGYVTLGGTLQNLAAAVPSLFLFLVLLLLPQAQLRVGQIKGIKAVPVPAAQRAAFSGVVLIVATLLVSYLLSTVQVSDFAMGYTLAALMLSLVLLTGYGGHVSFAQFTFAGIGAVTVAIAKSGSPLYLLLGAVIAAGVGAVVALPTIRLRGLYLALSTLAFAALMDKIVFQANFLFGFNGIRSVKRLDLFGTTLSSERSYLALSSIVFVLVALAVLALRRGRYGRLLIALRDSEAACGTLGLNTRWTRVGLFALSAGIAGLVGGVFAGLRESVGNSDFQVFNSLPLLLLAVVGGATSITGAWIGGMALMLLPILQSKVPAVAGLEFLVVGGFAILLGRNPNGIASYAFAAGRWLRTWRQRHARPRRLVPGEPVADEAPLYAGPEEVAVGGLSRG
jgi:branched-chain amino acid transport system permease protein